jgi:acetyl-CoA carboxylase biotin carboxylase subunit
LNHPPFSRVLVANRGEIAVRVIRACRELGIESVAVYSEPDRLAPHVLRADLSVPIGPARATESYLDGGKLIAAARQTNAEAIHPGYGFLAENPDFARAVGEAGLVFIGPPPEAIEAMGDKTRARELMRDAGVPVVPGSDAVTGGEDAATAARDIGFPLMLKAAAGGGGKGMRVVRDLDELEPALKRARSEAEQAFGDPRVYLERFLERPRHIEIQVLADGCGTVVHLGERECSIQRRHQKLIEESPSPVVDEGLRERMGRVAIEAARTVGYRGAGTVEFLFVDGEFYFLEMNTRIQVEHPVTELVTGVDLVQEQIRVAAGDRLGWEPDPGWPLGHAIECRIGGEDPFNGFLPSAGRITELEAPAGPGVRWDSGIAAGYEVGLHYDPLLAKLVVHGADRLQAIGRMRRALEELHVGGIITTQSFHLAVMEEPDFLAGRLSIEYLDDHPDLLHDAETRLLEAAAIAAVLLEEERRDTPRSASARADGRPRVRSLSSWQRAREADVAGWGPRS